MRAWLVTEVSTAAHADSKMGSESTEEAAYVDRRCEMTREGERRTLACRWTPRLVRRFPTRLGQMVTIFAEASFEVRGRP